MNCPECSRDFPADLLHELETGYIGGNVELKRMCPLCAYEKYINPERRVPPDMPPKAPKALALWQKAKRHVEAG